MAEQEIISYEDAYARTEAIFDVLSPVLPDGVSREVFLEIVAEAALPRRKRKARSAASLDRQIRYVTRLLIDEAACSPLNAKLVLRMAALDDAVDQQLSHAFEDDHSERHREFSLSYRFQATDRLTMPVIFIDGALDHQTALEPQQELASQITDGSVLSYERSGHFPFIDEPDRFAIDVEAFLARLKASGR